MKAKLRALLTVSIFLVSLSGGLPGCNQPDNPKPVESPPPSAPKQAELELPKKEGKAFDPADNPRYKKMMESMQKQSGGGR
jgi:hypothetical protein